MTPRFGRWVAMAEAGTQFPPRPGIVQVRLRNRLRNYPTGRSAMILYDAPSDLRGFARDLARANPGRDWLCRFMEPHVASGPAKSQAVLHELVERFRRRFGAAPSVPKGDG